MARITAGGIVGRHIYIYCHTRTNQVLYSLKGTLNEQQLRKQLPYLGKKTLPAGLRKDMWRPLATVTFPSERQGLDALQKLREFRKRHEFEWEQEEMHKLSKLKRGRVLQDQKANTVADLAAVMQLHEQVAEEHTELASGEEEEREEFLNTVPQKRAELQRSKAEARTTYVALLKDSETAALSGEQNERLEAAKHTYKRYKGELMRLKKRFNVLRPTGKEDLGPRTVPKPTARDRYQRVPRVTLDGVKIAWADILDAEYAETWPKSVVHDSLPVGESRQRHIAALDGNASSQVPRIRTTTYEEPVRHEILAEVQETTNKSALQKVVDRLRFGRKVRA